MQEWINQAEEDYLERDFTYKTPEELRKAVEELKVSVWRGSRPHHLVLIQHPLVARSHQSLTHTSC